MRKKPLLRCLSTAVLASAAASVCAQSLLVANQGDHTLSLLAPESGRTVATVIEGVSGEWGHEVAASADGRTAYLPIYGNSGVGRPGIDGRELLVIDVPSHRIAHAIDFGHGVRPHLPVLDAQHGLLYVTTELDDAVTAIDVKTLRIVAKIPTGQKESHMLVLSHDGRLGYTANVGPGTVSVLDMVGRKTLAVIPVTPDVQRIAISRDDRYVFTSDQKQPRLARTIDVARSPQEVLIRPDGKMAYVSCAGSGQVAAIDLADWKLAKLLTAGTFADGLAWAP